MDIKISDIEELAEYYRTEVYADQKAAFLEDEEFYNLDFKSRLDLPKEHMKHALVLSTGRDTIDTFCNHTSVINATVDVNDHNPSEKGKEEAIAARKFGQGIIYMTNLNAPISPWWLATKHYWIHGDAWLRTLWAADLWPDKPQRDKNESDESYGNKIEKWQKETGKELPIRINAIHPHNMYPDPDVRETDHVIEINEYHWMKATKFKKWRNLKGREKAAKVRHISYWDKEKHCELVDGEPIIRTRTGWDYHGYGFIPYVELNSGLGNMSHDNDMAQRCVGLLRYIQWLLIAESASFSINNIVLRKSAWPTINLRGDNAQLAQIEEQFGGANIIPDGVEIIEYAHTQPPDELFRHFITMHDLAAEHGAPRAMKGQGEQGVRSGAHQRMMSAEAGTRLNHAIQTFKYGTAKVLENCAKLVKVIPGDIRVYAKTSHMGVINDVINKNLINDDVSYSVEFSTVSPEDEYRRHDDLIRNVQGGLYTQRKAWEEMPNVDADDMEKQFKKDFWSKHPAIQESLARIVQVKMQKVAVDLLGAEAVMSTPQQPPQGGQPGQLPQSMGPMNPDMTQRAPIGSAQYMQNELKGMRSQTPINPMQGQGGGGERGVNR